MYESPEMSVRTHILTPPLKWHGGKHYLATRIMALMPRHLHYVEPYFGGGAVLLARDPDDQSLWLAPHKGVSEVANDLNGRLVNFWRVLQDEENFRRFVRMAQAIPLSRTEWEAAHSHVATRDDQVLDALGFFVDCRQSRSGLMKGFTPITRRRTRREMNGNVSEWLSAVDGLPDIHARLRRVLIENIPAIDLIQREDTPGTLLYCDPPYLHETRKAPTAYEFEMTEADHEELLHVLCQCTGKVMLSGYPSELYDRRLAGWSRHTFDLPNNAAMGKEKRRETEVLWCNF
jgi:DNA adenine methylase